VGRYTFCSLPNGSYIGGAATVDDMNFKKLYKLYRMIISSNIPDGKSQYKLLIHILTYLPNMYLKT